MKSEVVRSSIEELKNRFEENPLDFTVEDSLVFELTNILRKRGKKIEVSAEYRNFDNEDYEENYTDYKRKYIERICKQEEIHNVQIQVNIGKPWKSRGVGKNRRLDLAVLKENTEIRLIRGTKYFLPQFVEHAVEVKFIKNKNLPPKSLGKFKRDIEKLKSLGESKSRHLVIFSNKNIFQVKEEDKRSTSKARRRFEKLENKAEEDIEVWNCFPRR